MLKVLVMVVKVATASRRVGTDRKEDMDHNHKAMDHSNQLMDRSNRATALNKVTDHREDTDLARTVLNHKEMTTICLRTMRLHH